MWVFYPDFWINSTDFKGPVPPNTFTCKLSVLITDNLIRTSPKQNDFRGTLVTI